MKPKNLLYIISDEHRRDALGCYGHPLVQTPNIDRLAAGGVRFTNGYTPSPMCVPCRAALHTGRWVHDIGNWSSAEPYEGQVEGWAHRLRDAGHRVTSIGKLHFRDSHARNGFTEEIVPLHVMNGVGWTHGLLRDELPVYSTGLLEFAEQIGRGPSSYTDYDKRVTSAACDWLEQRAAQPDDKPWVTFLSLVSPHYPLIAPEEFYDLYDPADIELPIGYPFDLQSPNIHPALREWYEFYQYDKHFDEALIRKAHVAYFALCTFLDDCIGKVLDTLTSAGLAENTRIVYTSDHGEMLGDHGTWTKMNMYESSAGIPFILSDVDGQAGTVCDTAVNLIDSYQTIMDCVGLPLNEEEKNELPGRSLYEIAQGADPDRVTFSEYHDGGTTLGHFMLRHGDWKLIYYARQNNTQHRHQLFNLVDDPSELNDLARSADHVEVLQECERLLREIVDPEAADAQAHADQRRKIAELGGREAVVNSIGDFGFTPIS
ncbi:MAG: choline-sulfatase [Cellvibrionaceae bacterium]|jgi:choline-sulfatase